MAGDRPHILLIDDDVDMHAVIRLILTPLGCRLTCCTTTPEGLSILRSDKPDLLLLDVMLSTPTEGLELASQLRSEDEFRSLPIVLVSSTPQDSGFEDPGTTGAGRRAADVFLEKPLDARKLREVVEGILSRT